MSKIKEFKKHDRVIVNNDLDHLCLCEGQKGVVVNTAAATVYVEFDNKGGYWVLRENLELLKGEDVGIKTEDIFGVSGNSALDKQVSGDHYKSCGIQPIEYIHANGLDYFEGNAVKYITRHRKKNGKADIEKAIHYLELLLELEYKDK